MLATLGSRFCWTYNNASAPNVTPGTSVTPGASNAEGSWTQIAAAASITQDVWGILLWINGGNTSTSAKNHALDIGVDPAGGTSYTERVANMLCGQSHAGSTGGYFYYLPLFIKAGSAVAVRIQGSAGTAGTVRVAAKFFGKPSRPEMVRAGSFAETIGFVSNAVGTSFTPGNSGAEGSWVSLGTTTRALWWWQLCVQINNTTTTALNYACDLAFGDASNKHMIIQDLPVILNGTAEQTTQLLVPNSYCEVPAGATIYVRGSCSGTTVSGFNATAVGIGG